MSSSSSNQQGSEWRIHPSILLLAGLSVAFAFALLDRPYGRDEDRVLLPLLWRLPFPITTITTTSRRHLPAFSPFNIIIIIIRRNHLIIDLPYPIHIPTRHYSRLGSGGGGRAVVIGIGVDGRVDGAEGFDHVQDFEGAVQGDATRAVGVGGGGSASYI